MEKNLKTEVYRCIKSINVDNIIDDDKKELLGIFMHTENPLIRNHIALMFSDLKYDEAARYIIKKIMHKSTYTDNGTLVYALENLDCKKYFLSLIKIICEMDYEARLQAYEIVKDMIYKINKNKQSRAIEILEKRKIELDKTFNVNKGTNSTLHFVEKTLELLKKGR